MVTITTRAGKGSPLTVSELDSNFTNLNSGKIENATTRISTKPSLNLNFTKEKALDSIVAYSRASTATYIDSNGSLKTAVNGQPRFAYDPVTRESLGLMVEVNSTNIFGYSEHLTEPNHQRNYGIVIPNAAESPSGRFNAYLFRGENSGSGWDIYSTDYGANSGATQTLSVFAKANTTGIIKISLASSAVNFNLLTGTKVSEVDATGIIQEYPNGWYRISATAVKGNVYHYWGITIDNGAATSNSVYLWGVQLENLGAPTSYIPSAVSFSGRTSTATFIGPNGLIQTASAGIARYQYNPDDLSAPPYLLLEPSKTNLLLNSQNFSAANWDKFNATVTGSQGIAPDGTNTVTKVVFSGGTASYERTVTQSLSNLGAGVRINFSIWMRGEVGGEYVELVDRWGGGSSFLLTTTLKRYEVTFLTNGTSNNFHLQGANNITFYIWGAQAETNTYATSYIPTTTAQVTRAADTSTTAQTTRALDSVEISNLSSWFNRTEGTLISIAKTPPGLAWNHAQIIGAFTNSIYRNFNVLVRGYYASGIWQSSGYVWNWSAYSFGNVNYLAGNMYEPNRIGVIKWDTTSAQYVINNNTQGEIVTDRVYRVMEKTNRFVIGPQDSIDSYYILPVTVFIKQIVFYPKKLSSTEYQSLTS